MGTSTMMAVVGAGESISFSKVAAIYDATRGGTERGDRFAASIAPFCGPGPVVEIGVGTGIIARPLQAASARPVVGFDLAPEMLAYAHERLGARVGVADVAALPVRDGAVGTVVACWLIHLVGDPAAVLREVRRVLRPDGRLVVLSSRGELEPDDMDEVMVDLHDELRGRLDVSERLVPLAAACGLRLEVETTTGPGTWEESPTDLIERMERRQWGVLIDLDQERYDAVVQPVVDGLRGLPERDRKRVRIARHRLFVFTPA
jgi:SAM-dependent methyltransferase